ncbi:hypothetical protein, partial [Bradyrhizobium sp.]|uniref:hypothetical protein n=1 Tax=Bradyrhizobium sp. TaxID=376 RepID=UPI003C565300
SDTGRADEAAGGVICCSVGVGGKKLLNNIYRDTNNVRTFRYHFGARSTAATFRLFGTTKLPAEV